MTNDEALAIVRLALRSVLATGTILESVDEIERALDRIEDQITSQK
jgi:hypothetical protein